MIEAMMGTDYDERVSPCPCGKGKVIVEQSSPDHPWVRESQIHYSASLDCSECQTTYVIIQGGGERHPYLTYRSDVAEKSAAELALRQCETEFLQSNAAQALLPHIIQRIDEETTAASRHRLLQSMHFSVGSISTYRRNQLTGEEATRRISGSQLAYIGSIYSFDGIDQSVFHEVRKRIESYQKAAWGRQLRRVKTGATWLAC